MKKTLLSVLAGLTVIGSAFADGPSVEDRKKLCQLLIDKGTHVWVEKTKACIPVNPCLSDDEQIKKAYCDTGFKDVQVGNETQAIALAKKYLSTHNFGDPTCHVLKTTLLDQDYIECRTIEYDNGNYRVFEFDDISDVSNQTDVVVGVIKGTCVANGRDLFKVDERTYFNLVELFRSKGDDNSVFTLGKRRSWGCYEADEQKCKEMANFATNLLGSSPTVNSNYTEETGCVLTPDNF